MTEPIPPYVLRFPVSSWPTKRKVLPYSTSKVTELGIIARSRRSALFSIDAVVRVRKSNPMLVVLRVINLKVRFYGEDEKKGI